MKIKHLPITKWDFDLYNSDDYCYGEVDIYIDSSNMIGERVNCIFRSKDIKKYDDNNCTDFTLAILCNSCYIKSGIEELKGLNAGQIIPIVFEGEFNPTIPLDWIIAKFWTL